MAQKMKGLKLLDRDRRYQPKTYKVRSSGSGAIVVDVPAEFLIANKIEIGAEVYRFMDDDGDLIISPRLLTEED